MTAIQWHLEAALCGNLLPMDFYQVVCIDKYHFCGLYQHIQEPLKGVRHFEKENLITTVCNHWQRHAAATVARRQRSHLKPLHVIAKPTGLPYISLVS